MYNVSQDFKNEMILNDNHAFNISFKIRLSTGRILEITNDDLWENGFALDDATSSSGSFDVGTAIIQQLSIVLNNMYEDFSDYDFRFAKIYDIKIGFDNVTDKVEKGVFTVDEIKGSDIITMVCLDNMVKFDTPYSSSTLEYPTTVKTIVLDACENCGVEYACGNFFGYNYSVQERPKEDCTYREVLSWIGEMIGHYFRCDKNGALSCGWYNQSDLDNSRNTHNITNVQSVEPFSEDVQITGVKIELDQTGEESEEKISETVGTDDYMIVISNNPFINADNIRERATSLGNRVIGLKFRPLTANCLSDPTIEAGDCAIVHDVKGKSYKTFITSTKFSSDGLQEIACGSETEHGKSFNRFNQSSKIYSRVKTAMEADHIKVTLLEAEQARINDLVAESAKITDLNAQTARIDELYTGTAIVDHLKASSAYADYMEANYAKLTNGYIDIGVIKDGSIADAKIIGVSANKLTAGTIDASKINVTNLNADNLTVGTINGKLIGNGSIDLDSLAEEVPTKEYLDSVQENLQGQIDGAIETFTTNTVPTLSNYPASGWTDAKTKKQHVGDLCYVLNAGNTADGHCYRFAESQGGTYSWVLIQDSDVTKALQQLIDVNKDISGLKTFETNISKWKDETDESISSTIARTSTIETTYATKTVAQGYANTAKSEAISSANSTAQGYANTAKSEAISSANSTAQGYANTAKSEAISSANSTAKGYADAAESNSKSYADTAVNNVQVGGRNLLKNSHNLSDWKAENQSLVKITFNDDSMTMLGLSTTNSNLYGVYKDIKIEKNTSYCIGFDIQDYTGTINISVGTTASVWAGLVGYKKIPETPRFAFTFNSGDNTWVRLYFSTLANGNASIKISNFKLEKGNKATDWTPAPEDVEDSINAAETNAKGYADQVVSTKVETSVFNTLKQSVDENSATITSLSNTVSTKADSSTVTTLSNTVNAVKQTADGNSTKISNLTTTVNNKADGSTVTALSNRTTAVEQDLSGFKSTVSNTYATKNSLNDYSTTTQMNSAINQKADEITLAASKAYTTKTEFNNLNIGGRNLVICNSLDTKWSINGITIERNGFDWRIYGKNTKKDATFGFAKWIDTKNSITPKEYYTLSTDKPLPNGFYIQLNSIHKTGGYGIAAGPRLDGGSVDNKKVSTAIISENSDGSCYGFFGINPILDTVDFTFRLKFEKGNKATDWTPAPEDISDEIAEAKEAAIKVAADQIKAMVKSGGGSAEYTQTSSGFTWTVSGLQGAKGDKGDSGDKGASVVASVSRSSFTEAQWAIYGATDHVESWLNTSSSRNGCRIGDIFTVVGTATDTKNAHVAYYVSDTNSGNLRGKCISHSIAERGATGATGAAGKTPVKGTDYFTSSEIIEIETNAADKVDVGGRNLALNSENLSCGKLAGTSSNEYAYIDFGNSYMDLKVNETITISFDCEYVCATDSFRLLVYNSNRRGPIGFANAFCPTPSNFEKGKTIKFRGAVTVKAQVRTSSEMNNQSNFIEFYSDYYTGRFFSITNVKVERGNKATDWTPAPEDVDVGISAAQSTANAAQTAAGEAKTAASNAAKTATNYLNFDSNGLVVGDMTASSLGNNVQIKSNGVNIREGSTDLATFTKNGITLDQGKLSIKTDAAMVGGYTITKTEDIVEQEISVDVAPSNGTTKNMTMIRSSGTDFCLSSGDPSSYNYAGMHMNRVTSGDKSTEASMIASCGDKGKYGDALIVAHSDKEKTTFYGDFHSYILLQAEAIFMNSSYGKMYICGENKLWTGVLYMQSTHVITLPRAISTCMYGIVFVWSYYTNGAYSNSRFTSFFIPKYAIRKQKNSGFTMSDPYWGMFKYLYINDTTITGHDRNGQNGTYNGVAYANTSYVLRYIIGV